MIRHGLVAWVLLLFCSYSYCETITSQTTNAASNGLQWTMTNVLPQYTGLVVNSVNYRYTAVKASQDPFEVSVQNYNSSGTGYVFRSQDSWTGRPGNTITKTVPVEGIPLTSWGSGEIATTGIGKVESPYVLYGYTYDTCKLTPVTDSRCPNYRPPMADIPVTDPVETEYVHKSATPRVAAQAQEELDQTFMRLAKESTVARKRNVDQYRAIQNALLTAEALAQADAFTALNNISNFASYSKQLPGGTYQDSLKYVDKILPDNRAGRGLAGAQERLHNKLLDSQYDLKK